MKFIVVKSFGEDVNSVAGMKPFRKKFNMPGPETVALVELLD